VQGVQGPQGSGLNVVAANGEILGMVVSVTRFSSGPEPVIVARKDRDVWLAIGLDANGVAVASYPIFYDTPDCTGAAYAYVEASPVPLFRALQRMLATDSTAFYPGNPLQLRPFQAMQIEDPRSPGTKTCVLTKDYSYDAPQFVGPMQTIDLTAFPAPFSVQ
jgi:hypothetical protein